MCEKISVEDNVMFDAIVEDIKKKNLSKVNPPKIVVGTGLSASMGVPGMKALAKELDKKFSSHKKKSMSDAWKRVENAVKKDGLENGLSLISDSDEDFIEEIKKITACYILEKERNLQDKIYRNDSGFSSLMKYLKASWSVNNCVLDIMTPNYDRIIEIICDRLRIPIVTGFVGEVFQTFDQNVLRLVETKCTHRTGMIVRLFKPHGSLNWIANGRDILLSNDQSRLKENIENVEIVTPGNSKYKAGLTVNIFREMREVFHEVLERQNDYSLLIYGYGFNDPQFDMVLKNIMEADNNVNVLIISMEVKQEILEIAQRNSKISVFFQNGVTKMANMIYKGKQYEIDEELWNLEKFVSIFC